MKETWNVPLTRSSTSETTGYGGDVIDGGIEVDVHEFSRAFRERYTERIAGSDSDETGSTANSVSRIESMSITGE